MQVQTALARKLIATRDPKKAKALERRRQLRKQMQEKAPVKLANLLAEEQQPASASDLIAHIYGKQ